MPHVHLVPLNVGCSCRPSSATTEVLLCNRLLSMPMLKTTSPCASRSPPHDQPAKTVPSAQGGPAPWASLTSNQNRPWVSWSIKVQQRQLQAAERATTHLSSSRLPNHCSRIAVPC